LLTNRIVIVDDPAGYGEGDGLGVGVGGFVGPPVGVGVCAAAAANPIHAVKIRVPAKAIERTLIAASPIK
jgi:hypothetical protein